MSVNELIITQEEANVRGLIYYFTGVPCRNGHVDKRYMNTNICYECKRSQVKRDYNKHKQRVICTNSRSNIKNKDRVKATKNKWIKENREKSNLYKIKYKIRNRKKYLKYCREYQKNKRKDPFYRVNRAMSKAIWSWLKSGKGYRRWESLVDFTMEELIERFESLFKPDMTWDNYGSLWSVDHIKPQSLCSSFEEAWQLTNLQPLYCSLNSSKCNRWIG